jgi:integrase
MRLDRIDVDAIASLVERMQTAEYRQEANQGLALARLASACKRADIAKPWPTFHELRHAHASAWIANGGDLVELSARLGHRDPSVTAAVYSHQFETAARSESRRTRLDNIYGFDDRAQQTMTPCSIHVPRS